MSEAKFTPAPWNVATVICNGESFAAVIDEHRNRLATMPDYGAAAQANAVLMSYAPQMYALLEELLTSEKAQGTPFLAYYERAITNLLALARGEDEK